MGETKMIGKCKYWKTCKYYDKTSKVCNTLMDRRYCGQYRQKHKNKKP